MVTVYRETDTETPRVVPAELCGGFTEAARHLKELYPHSSFTRQNLFQWWARRGRNGFPEGFTIARPSTSTPKRMFDLDEVARWYQQYVPSTGGRTTKKQPSHL